MKHKYVAPLTKDGKIQHVPIVCRNKDAFIGFIECYTNLINNICEIIDLSNEDHLRSLAPGIDSSRFNHYIADGIDARNMSENEIKEYELGKIREILDAENEHPDNNVDVLTEMYFGIDCECGNYISFKNAREIPETNLHCDVCDRVLIQYTGLYDDEIDIE